jgi:hypothetical protein
LVEAAATGCRSERSRPRRGNRGSSILVLRIRVAPVQWRRNKRALGIGDADHGPSGVEVAAVRADGRVVAQDGAEAQPFCCSDRPTGVVGLQGVEGALFWEAQRLSYCHG